MHFVIKLRNNIYLTLSLQLWRVLWENPVLWNFTYWSSKKSMQDENMELESPTTLTPHKSAHGPTSSCFHQQQYLQSKLVQFN